MSTVSEKRERIANCIVNLKGKSLKNMRRQDIDEAVQVLLMYDSDLKTSKPLQPQPIQKQGQNTVTEQSQEEPHNVLKAVIINNDDGTSIAYPLVDNTEKTVLMVESKKLQPIAPVIIEKWMREHYQHEVSFSSLYATIVTGYVVTTEKDIITVGCDVKIKDNIYKVTSVTKDSIKVERGFFKSFFSINIKEATPVLKTKVSNFKVLEWVQ